MKQNEALKQVARAWKKFAQTTEGELLMANLETRYCKNIRNETLQRDVGSMDVVLYLKRLGESNE